MTNKQRILQMVERWPEDISFDRALYHMFVLKKIDAGLKDIEAGRTRDFDEVFDELERRCDEEESQAALVGGEYLERLGRRAGDPPDRQQSLLGGQAMTDTVEIVRRWFGLAVTASGPILPDGWFGGRPYENQFFLQSVEASEDGKLVIRLSQETTLMVANPRQVFLEDSELIFEDFDEAILQWKDYGGKEYDELRYAFGRVSFAPLLGKVIEFR